MSDNELNVFDEALDVLRVIGGFSEPTRYRTYELFEDEAVAVLDHIAAQDKCIAELEAALKSKTSRVKTLERMMLYIHTDEHGDVNYTDIDLREKIAELEADLENVQQQRDQDVIDCQRIVASKHDAIGILQKRVAELHEQIQ